MSTGRPKSFPVVPTLLLSVFLGAVIGVVLLLLFRGPRTDTVSAVNSGVAGTTVTQAQGGGAAPEDAAGAATAGGAGTGTPATGTSGNGTTPPEGGSGTSQVAVAEEHPDPTYFDGKTGAELYVQACQSCHMPEGRGADNGAGVYTYPALAGNTRLATPQYIGGLVINGNGGMPGFGHYLNYTQIADIVNYVRTELNTYLDKVTPADVKSLRPTDPNYMLFGESAG